jgi:hypothetical protein
MSTQSTEMEEQLPTFEQIAEDIQSIADAMKRIDSTRLNRKALVTLLHEMSKVKKSDIEYVLNSLAFMDRQWLRSLPRTEK